MNDTSNYLPGKVGRVKSAYFSTSADMVTWEPPQILYTPAAVSYIQFYSYREKN